MSLRHPFSTFPSRLLRRAALYLCAFAACAGLACATEIETAFSTAGLTSLRWQGEELLSSGAIYSYGFFLKPDGSREFAGSATQTTFEASAKRWTLTFPWGEVLIQYVPQGTQMQVRATITNRSPNPIVEYEIGLLKLKFPRLPAGQAWANGFEVSDLNIDDITALPADYASGMLVLCNDQVGAPLKFGFTGRQGDGYVVRMTTNVNHRPSDPIIAPGETRQFSFSLRFAPGGTDAGTLIGDLHAALAAQMPQELVWPDRRAIGTVFLANGYFSSATNPRGWLNDSTLDVLTAAGRANFRTQMLAKADECLATLRDMNAQGMIFWDVEGEQFPYITYAGDPTRLADLAPEMDTIADAFFQKFRDAGLRTGVCIRPSRIVPGFPGNGHVWDHDNAGFDVLTNLSNKIAAAQARWGCTLIYIDTNVSWALDDDGAFVPSLLRASLLHDLRRLHPDVLIIPEIPTTQYWASSAPYREVRGGFTATPARSRAVYPGAFSIIEPKDSDFGAIHAALVDAVRAGDILLFRAWYPDAGNAPIKAIYAEAHPPPTITTNTLPAATVGDPFSATIVSNGVSLFASSLPPGLTLAPASGVLSGTPTVAGDALITFTAQSLWGSAVKTLALPVRSVFEQWTATHFPGDETSAAASASSDPDGDGATNFVEFSRGTDPHVHDAATSEPRFSVLNDGTRQWLTITFRRRTGAFPGVVYRVEESANLATWNTVDEAANRVGDPTDLGDGVESVTIRGTLPLGEGASGFLRLDIQ